MISKILVLAFNLALLQVAQSACPTIVSRAEWGARAPSTTLSNLPNPVTYAVIHHSAGGSCTTKANCITTVKNIQTYHMNTNGWSDIGYNFLVGEDGNVYEGRGWTKVGAHAPAYNSNSIGICMLGTFSTGLPNSLALNAAQTLIQCGVEKGYIKQAYTLKGHRDGSATECPGQKLYDLIRTWPNYS